MHGDSMVKLNCSEHAANVIEQINFAFLHALHLLFVYDSHIDILSDLAAGIEEHYASINELYSLRFR